MKPYELIQSWNALQECVKHNMQQAKFTGQAKGIINDVSVKNEVHKWNELTSEEREFLADKNLSLDIDKIDVVPDSYANADIKALQRFFEVELEQQQTEIDKLLEESDQ